MARRSDVEALLAQRLLHAVEPLDEAEGGGAAQGEGAFLDVRGFCCGHGAMVAGGRGARSTLTGGCRTLGAS